MSRFFGHVPHMESFMEKNMWVGFQRVFFFVFFSGCRCVVFFFKLISYNITVLWSFGLVVLVFGAT